MTFEMACSTCSCKGYVPLSPEDVERVFALVENPPPLTDEVRQQITRPLGVRPPCEG